MKNLNKGFIFMNKIIEFVIFKTKDEKISINVRLENDTVWLTIEDMANLFEKSKSKINENIF